MDADQFGPFDVPSKTSHDIHGVGAADSDGHHAEAAGVRGVAVGADHHAAGESVLFEYYLVDYA